MKVLKTFELQNIICYSVAGDKNEKKDFSNYKIHRNTFFCLWNVAIFRPLDVFYVLYEFIKYLY